MVNLPAAEVNISLRDGSGSVGRVALSVADSIAVTAARGAIESLLGPLSGISECAIVGYSITYKTHLFAGDPTGPAPTANRALLVFATDQTDQYCVLTVPGVRAELVAADGEIDPTQPDVAALAALVTAAGWCNPFGADATALLNSYQQVDP